MSTLPTLYDTVSAAQGEAPAYQIGSVTGLQWADADKTTLSCVVAFSKHPLGITDAMPFNAHANDSESHGREIFYRALQGEYGAIADYAPDVAMLSAQAVAARDALLTSTQIAVDTYRDEVEEGGPTTLTADQYAALQAYRRALRAIEQQPGYPVTIDWPVAPTY